MQATEGCRCWRSANSIYSPQPTNLSASASGAELPIARSLLPWASRRRWGRAAAATALASILLEPQCAMCTCCADRCMLCRDPWGCGAAAGAG